MFSLSDHQRAPFEQPMRLCQTGLAKGSVRERRIHKAEPYLSNLKRLTRQLFQQLARMGMIWLLFKKPS